MGNKKEKEKVKDKKKRKGGKCGNFYFWKVFFVNCFLLTIFFNNHLYFCLTRDLNSDHLVEGTLNIPSGYLNYTKKLFVPRDLTFIRSSLFVTNHNKVERDVTLVNVDLTFLQTLNDHCKSEKQKYLLTNNNNLLWKNTVIWLQLEIFWLQGVNFFVIFTTIVFLCIYLHKQRKKQYIHVCTDYEIAKSIWFKCLLLFRSLVSECYAPFQDRQVTSPIHVLCFPISLNNMLLHMLIPQPQKPKPRYLILQKK